MEIRIFVETYAYVTSDSESAGRIPGKLSKPELVVKALHNFWEFSLLFDEAI